MKKSCADLINFLITLLKAKRQQVLTSACLSLCPSIRPFVDTIIQKRVHRIHSIWHVGHYSPGQEAYWFSALCSQQYNVHRCERTFTRTNEWLQIFAWNIQEQKYTGQCDVFIIKARQNLHVKWACFLKIWCLIRAILFLIHSSYFNFSPTLA